MKPIYTRGDCTKIAAERDRLAAENAELRKGYQANTDAATYSQNKMWDMGKQLVAANTTLDRLREVVPEGALCYCYECEAFVVGSEIGRSYNKRCPHCEVEDLTAFAHELQAILYPPETTNDDQI